MQYNIYIKTFAQSQNIVDMNEYATKQIINKIKQGEEFATIGGAKYFIKDPYEIRIFEYELTKIPVRGFMAELRRKGGVTDVYGSILPEEFKALGKEVTNNFVSDLEFDDIPKRSLNTGDYVDQARIKELKALKPSNFDLKKLIALCNELNVAHREELILTKALLVRTICNHVPPLFGYQKFSEVANNYTSKGNSKSFKELMQKLEETSRKVADSIAHSIATAKESLPTNTQVNFSQELDFLLQEVCKICK